MTINYDLFLPVATILRRTGHAITEPIRRSGQFGTRQKSDQSLVTIADTQAQEFMSEALRDCLPGAQILGEESFDHNRRWQDSTLLDDLGDVFIVDPIDGTVRFARGDDYGIMTALRRQGRLCAAWIYYPVTDEMLFASELDATTRITWTQGIPVAHPVTIPVLPLEQIVLNTYSTRLPSERMGSYIPIFKGMFQAVRRSECGATELRDMLATGRNAQFIDFNTPWDRAPTAYLAERAGAPTVVDFQGQRACDQAQGFIITPHDFVRDAIMKVVQGNCVTHW